ncbi:Ig-like domain-containing domain, partial [Treponema sp. R6D11]
LLSSYPEMYSEISDARAEIKLEFSIPLPLKTLYDNVSFSPSMTGIWRLEKDGKLAIFTPAEPWMQKTRYEIRFSTSLTDNNGMNIGNDFLCVFTTKLDPEIPYLVNAMRITNKNELIILSADRGYSSVAESPVENQDWEKDDKLLLVFSKPVDSISVKNYTSVEN